MCADETRYGWIVCMDTEEWGKRGRHEPHSSEWGNRGTDGKRATHERPHMNTYSLCGQQRNSGFIVVHVGKRGTHEQR